MVNLETVDHRPRHSRRPRSSRPGQRYHFRTSPAALDVLAAAGVDVVTMANNHGADYGPVGLRGHPAGDPHQPGPRRRHRREPPGGLHAVPGLGPGHRLRVPRRGRLDPRGRRAASGPPGRRRPGIAAAHAAQAPRPARRGPRGQPPRRRRGGLPALGRGAPGLPHRPAADHRAGPGRRRRGRHRRQPRPRPARLRVAGRHLRRLRPRATSSGTTTTSPRPACSGCASGTVRWSVTPGPGPDPDRRPPAPPHRPRHASAAVADWRRLRGCTGLAPGPRLAIRRRRAPRRRRTDGVHRDRPADRPRAA